MHIARGSEGILPRRFLKFEQSEIISGAFLDKKIPFLMYLYCDPFVRAFLMCTSVYTARGSGSIFAQEIFEILIV